MEHDKSTWGDGPWQNEPDRLEWKHDGVPCLAVRRNEMGHWCGYAAIEPGHPWHGRHYDDVPAEAHGGLTYSDRCTGSVCHVPKPGEPDDVWWIGFDCAHCDDLAPGTRALLGGLGFARTTSDVYRDLEYVKAGCQRLAEQVIAARETSTAAEDSDVTPRH